MSISDIGAAAGSRIGRYFGLVSALPSAALVLFVYFLISSGAWGGPPDWHLAVVSLSHIGLGTAGVLSIVTVFVGLVLHPLQFSLVQLYEGYWGVSRLSRRIASARSMRHWRYVQSLRGDRILLNVVKNKDNQLTTAYAEMRRIEAAFPEQPEHFMPTRLGNVLRRWETQAGAPFGLQAVQVVPQLALVARDRDVEYLNDQRAALDLAVRLSVTSLIACGFSVVFLGRDGLWLLLALIPYGLAYLFYRGAVVTAHEYGAAISALIALNRFALYERLGISRPGGSEEERDLNRDLRELFEFQEHATVTYGPRGSAPWWRRIAEKARSRSPAG